MQRFYALIEAHCQKMETLHFCSFWSSANWVWRALNSLKFPEVPAPPWSRPEPEAQFPWGWHNSPHVACSALAAAFCCVRLPAHGRCTLFSLDPLPSLQALKSLMQQTKAVTWKMFSPIHLNSPSNRLSSEDLLCKHCFSSWCAKDSLSWGSV